MSPHLPARDLSAHLKAPTLSEADSKALLREAGIALPDEVLVTERDALDAAIERVGFPLVMKIQSPDIAHKSEVGGVRVGIATKGEAFSAYRELLENAGKHRPNAAIQGVLVCPMAKKGVEIIIGTLLDETFGPMVMVGLGGVTTELFRDVIYRPAPVGVAEAETMLGELKAAPLLRGFRGAPKADVAALSKLISEVSVLAARLKRSGVGDRAQSGAGASARAGRDHRRCAGGEEEITSLVVPGARDPARATRCEARAESRYSRCVVIGSPGSIASPTVPE